MSIFSKTKAIFEKNKSIFLRTHLFYKPENKLYFSTSANQWLCGRGNSWTNQRPHKSGVSKGNERQFLNLQLHFNSIRDFIQRRDGACECDLFLENVAKTAFLENDASSGTSKTPKFKCSKWITVAVTLLCLSSCQKIALDWTMCWTLWVDGGKLLWWSQQSASNKQIVQVTFKML